MSFWEVTAPAIPKSVSHNKRTQSGTGTCLYSLTSTIQIQYFSIFAKCIHERSKNQRCTVQSTHARIGRAVPVVYRSSRFTLFHGNISRPWVFLQRISTSGCEGRWRSVFYCCRFLVLFPGRSGFRGSSDIPRDVVAMVAFKASPTVRL